MTIWTGTTTPLPTLYGGLIPDGDDLTAITDSLHGLTDAWTSYTPVWTSTGTAPVIGNATVKGRYLQSGKLVMYVAFIQFGSTSTYGTGTYRFSLPVTQSDVDLGYGGALTYDASVPAAETPAVVVFAGADKVTFYGSGGQVGATVPFTWTTGDRLAWCLIYEAA